MPVPTDLQRIEPAFPAEAMLHVVDHAADPKDPAVQRVRRLLVGLADRDLCKLRPRLDRTMRAFLAPIVAIGGRGDVVGVIAWRILAVVLEADIPVLPEGTLLSDAIEKMRPALERAARDPIDFARVEVEWPAALRRLQAAGLYGAVTVRAERAACAWPHHDEPPSGQMPKRRALTAPYSVPPGLPHRRGGTARPRSEKPVGQERCCDPRQAAAVRFPSA